MSGHSHAKNVKRTKDADAKRRSLIFAKIGKNISLLAKQGGGVEANPALRTAVEKAREMNVPKDNIEKAIKKGTGELKESGNLEEFLFEAYGPGGIALIVEGITDNKNRILAEFKKALSDHGGRIAEPGSVKWLFNRKGLIVLNCDRCEEAELLAIESGAEDIEKNDGLLKIITGPEETDKIKKAINNEGEAESSLIWLPTAPIEINEDDKKRAEKLFEELDSKEDIQEIYSNMKE